MQRQPDNSMMSSFDGREILTRIFKYSLEGFVVAFVAFLLPNKELDVGQVAVLGLTAAAVFAMLDLFSPSIASSARFGVGAGVGFNMIQFPAPRPM
jgi:hypothetical protein